MNAVVYVPFVAVAVVVLVTRLVRDHIRPATAAVALTAIAAVSATTAVGALALLAWPFVARLPELAERGRWRPADIPVVDPVPVLVSVSALALLAVVVVRVGLAAARITSEQRDAARLVSLGRPVTLCERSDVVLIDDDRPVAVAASGLRCTGIVLSTAMLGLLPSDELHALVAHEAAHLDHRHHRHATAAALAVAAVPPLAPMRTELHHALERWADETAAGRAGRTNLARALARVALYQPHTATHLARFSATGGTLRRRVLALTRPSPHRRWPAAILATAPIVGVIAAVLAARQTEQAFEILIHSTHR